MATILKPSEREFRENPGRIEHYSLFTDILREKKGVNPQTLNFDIRRLDPGQYSSTYHFHRYSEELFVILAGSATLRSTDGLQMVEKGDLVFMESGEEGAHQLYNHTDEPCEFLDIRTFIGYDVCEYPDSDKVLLVPSMEVFKKNSGLGYFEGEEEPVAIWEKLQKADG